MSLNQGVIGTSIIATKLVPENNKEFPCVKLTRISKHGLEFFWSDIFDITNFIRVNVQSNIGLHKENIIN